MKIRQKLLVITILLTVLIAFTNSYDARGTEELSYIIALGIDKSDSQEEPLSISIQIAKPDNSESGGTKIKTEVKTVNCRSFNLGLSMLNLENVNELNLSHCTAIIISEELAKEGISDFINTLTNNIEIRPTCNVLICQNKASDFLEKASNIDDISSKFYNSFVNSAKITSYVSDSQLSSFFSSLHGDIKEPIAIYSFIKNDTIESLGLAIFKDYKMVGKLSGLETLLYNILTNQFEEGTIEVYNSQAPSTPLTIHISKSNKTKIKVKLENNTPIISCNIFLNSQILTANKNYDFQSENSKREIESEINKFIEQYTLEFLSRTTTLNTDILGFQGYFNENFLTQDQLNNYDWNQIYKNSNFEIHSTNYLISGYLFSKD